jgi:hypothetical protein
MYHGTRMTGNRRAASCLRPASRISAGGSSGAGGFKDQSSPPSDAARLDFQLALRAVHGLAVGNRVRQGENGLRHMEQGIDHQRVGIGRFGQANLGQRCGQLWWNSARKSGRWSGRLVERQMTAPTFLASLRLATDIVLIETIARNGVRLETKHGLRTARKGACSPIVPQYSPRGSGFATSPLRSPRNRGRPPRRSL